MMCVHVSFCRLRTYLGIVATKKGLRFRLVCRRSLGGFRFAADVKV